MADKENIIERAFKWIKKPTHLKIKSIRSRWITLYFSFFPKNTYTTKTKYGKIIFRNDYIGRTIYVGSYDEIELDFLAAFIPENSVIADIGANIGYYTLFFSQKKFSKVYSFEPSLNEFKLLKQNVELNNVSKKCVLEQLIVSSSLNDKTLHLSDINFGTNTIYPTSENKYSKSIVVKSTTLDDYVTNKKIKFDFIKLDVEGAELDVLKGAKLTLENQKPHLFIEAWETYNKHFSPENSPITLYLSEKNYSFFTITDNHKIKLIKDGDHVNEINILAIHKDKFQSIENYFL